MTWKSSLHFLLKQFAYFTCNDSVSINNSPIYSGFTGNVLSLASRLDIATDVAHAITYLHTYTGTTRTVYFFKNQNAIIN